jgi:sulfur-oxidizing protein SoxX
MHTLALVLGPLLFLFSDLVSAEDAEHRFAAAALSGTHAGDAKRGAQIFLDRERGHCLLCHQVAQLDAPFQGNLGPELSAVALRLSAAQIRFRIIDNTRLNANTSMPAYHRIENLRQVAKEYADQPVLNAQEVEDVVAFLRTLKLSDGG